MKISNQMELSGKLSNLDKGANYLLSVFWTLNFVKNAPNLQGCWPSAPLAPPTSLNNFLEVVYMFEYYICSVA